MDICVIKGMDTIRDAERNLIYYPDQLISCSSVREKGINIYRILGVNGITHTLNSPGHLVLNGTASVTLANQTSAADFESGDENNVADTTWRKSA